LPLVYEAARKGVRFLFEMKPDPFVLPDPVFFPHLPPLGQREEAVNGDP
jgi:hypothetical protein